jgi:hypothetical protein
MRFAKHEFVSHAADLIGAGLPEKELASER